MKNNTFSKKIMIFPLNNLLLNIFTELILKYEYSLKTQITYEHHYFGIFKLLTKFKEIHKENKAVLC